MSIPNPLTRHPSPTPLAPSPKLFPSVFWTARDRQRKQLQIRSPRSHYKNGLSSLSSSIPSLHSAATSLSTRILSQKFAWSQRSYCLLLSCLLLLRLELTGCDPHGSESTTKSHWNEISLLHQSMVGSQTSELTEGEHPAHHHHPPTDNIVISHKEDHFSQALPTRPPPSVRENGNQTSHFVSGENTASVIASSFRTFDQQQQQENPSDSKEESTGESNGDQYTMRRKPGQLRNCDTAVLKNCLSALPPMNSTGIPSSISAINTACRIYDAGINCFDTWAKQCLAEKHRKKVKESITGAHEMYTFLCKDPKFRSDYLKHKVCYKKLSPHWDECSRQFIEGLKRNTKHNHTVFCCIRLEFLTCVNKYSSYSCNREASRFLMKMAETLVRSTIRTKSDDFCARVHPDNCVPIVESSGATGVGLGAQLRRMIILINGFVLLFLPSVQLQLQLASSKFPGMGKRV